MSALLVEKMAQEYGLPNNIGKKVKSTSTDGYRHGEIAEIVGWEVLPTPAYHIRYDNGECDVISANTLIEERYVFVD